MDPAAAEHEAPAKKSNAADGPGGARRTWLAAVAASLGIPRRWLAAGAAVAIVAALAAVLLGRQIVSGPSSPARPKPAATAPTTPPAPTPAPTPKGFVRFDDSARGLSVALPKSWHRLPSPDDQVSVLATGAAGASMLMRTAPLGIEVGPDSIGAARKITDSLVRAAKQVKVVEGPKQVSVGGLPGYLYLYTYRDAVTGKRGGHAHYFLFRHQEMITIIFQVLPAERFAGLAPLFDQIAGTLRTSGVASGQSGAAPSTGPTAR